MYCKVPLSIPKKAQLNTAKCKSCHSVWHKLRSKYQHYGDSVDVHVLVRWYLDQPQECVICKSTSKLTIDRILPGSKGGKYEINNIQLLCYTCNCCKKRDYSSIEEGSEVITTKICNECLIEYPFTSEYWHRTNYKPKYLDNTNCKSTFHPKCKKCRLQSESYKHMQKRRPTRLNKIKYRDNYNILYGKTNIRPTSEDTQISI